MVNAAEVCIVPCGHVPYCVSCKNAASATSCPICRQPVGQMVRLFFSGERIPKVTVIEAPPEPSVMPEAEAQMAPADVIFALKDVAEADVRKFLEVQTIETWTADSVDDLDIGDAMNILGMYTTPEMDELLKKDNEKAYVIALRQQCQQLWRCLALRLHSDRANGEFWSEDKLDRLNKAFKFANNVQEKIMLHFATYLVPQPDKLSISYQLVKTVAEWDMAIIVSWKRAALDTCIAFYDEDDKYKVLVENGSEDEAIQEQRFSIFYKEHPYCFDPAFTEFMVFHKATFGEFNGGESFSVKIAPAVPPLLRRALEMANRAENRRKGPRSPVATWSSAKRSRYEDRPSSWCGNSWKWSPCNDDNCWMWSSWNDDKCWKGDSGWAKLESKYQPWGSGKAASYSRCKRKACMGHDPAKGRYCRNNRCLCLLVRLVNLEATRQLFGFRLGGILILELGFVFVFTLT